MTAEKTPLTDAAEQATMKPNYPAGVAEVEAWKHARQLERRCAELEEENARLDHCYKLSLDSMQLHKDKADELRRDRERLDWLEKISSWYGISGETETKVQFAAGGVYPLTVRAAIDAAMREASPPVDG